MPGGHLKAAWRRVALKKKRPIHSEEFRLKTCLKDPPKDPPARNNFRPARHLAQSFGFWVLAGACQRHGVGAGSLRKEHDRKKLEYAIITAAPLRSTSWRT